MMKYKDGGMFQDRLGMDVPQDPDGGSAKPKKPKKKAPRTKLPPLRPGQIDMPSDPDDGSVGMKHGGGVKKMKHGGGVKKMKHGGAVRGDGCAVKGKTKGRMV
jgi:hypothetical protein